MDYLERAAGLILSRPPRLGATRLVALDGPSGSGKTSLAGPLAAAVARRIGGEVMTPPRTVDGAGGGDGTSGAVPGPPGERPPVAVANVPLADSDVLLADPDVPLVDPDVPLVAVVSTDLLATWEHPLDWWPVWQETLLDPIAAGQGAVIPVVTWVSGHPRPGGSITVPSVAVLITEGVSSGRAAVADLLSALIWVEVPGAAARLERAVARDGEEMRGYLTAWQRDESAHFAADGTRARADLVIEPA